jgi:hypothetical protein
MENATGQFVLSPPNGSLQRWWARAREQLSVSYRFYVTSEKALAERRQSPLKSLDQSR